MSLKPSFANLAAFWLAIFSSVSIAVSNLQINTTVGKIDGFVNSTYPDVATFLGVPYAEPPLGDLRWLPPRSKGRAGSIINATSFAPACAQINQTATPSIHSVDAPAFDLLGKFSEDCLYLNIWAPYSAIAHREELLPIIIWIHGGDLDTGGSNIPYQNPTPWIQRTKKHIVVGIQ